MQSNNSNYSHGGYLTLGKSNLAFKTGTDMQTDASNYVADGAIYTNAAQTTLSFASGHTPLQETEVCVIVFGINAAGTRSQHQGKIHKIGNLRSNGGVEELDWPSLPVGVVPYAAVKVQTAGDARFHFGVTGLDATNVTATYYDLCTIPTTRPA